MHTGARKVRSLNSGTLPNGGRTRLTTVHGCFALPANAGPVHVVRDGRSWRKRSSGFQRRAIFRIRPTERRQFCFRFGACFRAGGGTPGNGQLVNTRRGRCRAKFAATEIRRRRGKYYGIHFVTVAIGRRACSDVVRSNGTATASTTGPLQPLSGRRDF